MTTNGNPSEIARETLRQLAMRRVAPTPDNYRKLYHEIAGTSTSEDAPPESDLRRIARRLPRDTPERQRHLRQLDQALAENDAKAADAALERYLDGLKQSEQPAWNEVIANLVRQWEARQNGWTTARKREALDLVLNASDAATLYSRLQGLLRGWTQAGTDSDADSMHGTQDAFAQERPSARPLASIPAANAPYPLEQADPVSAHDESRHGHLDAVRELLELSLHQAIPALLTEHADLAAEARSIASELGEQLDTPALTQLRDRLRKLTHEIEITAADDAEVRSGLLELLRLLLRNIDDLVLDDTWLSGQVEMLREITESKPDARKIDDAGQRLRELISKQGQLKSNLVASQRHLRDMLAGFVDQLARFSESTGTYHDRIGTCAQRIAQAGSIAEIGPLLDEVMQETRSMQDEARRSRSELLAAREEASAAQARITALQAELDESSRLMRHDQLTGALNRRGLDEMFQKEAARAVRRGTRLAVALLDIDHFKKLNDSLGHKVGDDALVHLSRIVRQHLRPQDVLARFGGEEFVILLPETSDDEAYQALVRLQRELTREFFMADHQKVVITFSAGVTPLLPGEAFEVALDRADGAMYQAKQAGRNRVVVAPAPTEKEITGS